MEDMSVKEKKHFIRDLFALALPMSVQNLINNAVTIADNLMIGSLGDDCISAVSVCWTYSWLYSVFSTAFASGALLMISRMWGKGDKKGAKQLMSFSLSVCFLLGLFLFVLTALFPETILRIYSNVESMIPVGVKYLKIMKYAYLVSTISYALMILLRSIRKVAVSMATSIGSCLINIFLNYVLIFGHFGFPQLGIEGAAIASLSARIFELAIVLIYLLVIDRDLHFRISDFDPFIAKNTMLSLIEVTLPLLVIDCLASLVSTMQTIITGHISRYYISANSIVHTSYETIFVFCWGFAQAANVIIGNIIGDGDHQKAYRYSFYFVITGLVMGAITSVSLHFIMPYVMSYYHVADETILLAKQMSYSASIIVLFSCYYTIVGEGVLKAGGNTKRLLKIDLLCSWLFAIPFGALCAFVFHLPAYVLYVILRSNNILKTFWSLKKLKDRDWIVQFE